jgi:predicted transcriptional regulator
MTETNAQNSSQKIRSRLNQLAEVAYRIKSYLPDQAINNYLSVHEWQALETKKAVNLANSPHAEWIDHQSIKSKWIAKLED